MEQPATLKTIIKILCPNCGESDHTVSHLFDEGGRTFGPWCCDACNHEFRGRVLPDNSVVITKVEPRDTECKLCLLKLRDLYCVVTGYSLVKGDQYDDHADYLFHSHQCPGNIMRSVDEVFDVAEGSDPHGIFRLVAYITDTPENRKKLDHNYGAHTVEELFRVFHTDGQPLPTDWPEQDGGVLSRLAAVQRFYAQEKMPKA
jgi:hypothetical protein